MTVHIELEFKDHLQATKVLDAVAPDNSPLPYGIAIKTKIIENKLVIHIECERSIDSLRATVEDIMSAIDLSVRTIQSIENESE
ncbi:MAG: KEOPS complex subunit Pcc1 [Candidatus Thorarchaeota archaeon]